MDNDEEDTITMRHLHISTFCTRIFRSGYAKKSAKTLILCVKMGMRFLFTWNSMQISDCTMCLFAHFYLSNLLSNHLIARIYTALMCGRVMWTNNRSVSRQVCSYERFLIDDRLLSTHEKSINGKWQETESINIALHHAFNYKFSAELDFFFCSQDRSSIHIQ